MHVQPFLFYSVNVDILFHPLLFYREQDQCDEWNCDNLIYIFSETFCVGVLYCDMWHCLTEISQLLYEWMDHVYVHQWGF